jgi:hypothetical protein
MDIGTFPRNLRNEKPPKKQTCQGLAAKGLCGNYFRLGGAAAWSFPIPDGPAKNTLRLPANLLSVFLNGSFTIQCRSSRFL